MTAIRRIAEVVINASDLSASSRFYQDALGLKLHAQFPEHEPTIVFLEVAPIDSPLGRLHPQLFAIIDPARHEPARGRFDALDKRSSTLNHIAFEIDEADFGSELARLTELGLKPMTSTFPFMQAKAIFFKDPEGNTLELICHGSNSAR